MWDGLGPDTDPRPPQFLYPSIYVHVFTIICMYIRKRQFCQIEAMKMRDPDRKMSLHAL